MSRGLERLHSGGGRRRSVRGRGGPNAPPKGRDGCVRSASRAPPVLPCGIAVLGRWVVVVAVAAAASILHPLSQPPPPKRHGHASAVRQPLPDRRADPSLPPPPSPPRSAADNPPCAVVRRGHHHHPLCPRRCAGGGVARARGEGCAPPRPPLPSRLPSQAASGGGAPPKKRLLPRPRAPPRDHGGHRSRGRRTRGRSSWPAHCGGGTRCTPVGDGLGGRAVATAGWAASAPCPPHPFPFGLLPASGHHLRGVCGGRSARLPAAAAARRRG